MSTAWVDCGEPDVATQRTPPHGCRSSSSEVREHPTVGGVADGVEHRLPSHPVVGHVEAAAGVRLAMVHGDDQLRTVSADRRGDRSPQRQSGLQRPVGKVEELERLDADGVAGGALLGGPQRRGLRPGRGRRSRLRHGSPGDRRPSCRHPSTWRRPPTRRTPCRRGAARRPGRSTNRSASRAGHPWPPSWRVSWRRRRIGRPARRPSRRRPTLSDDRQDAPRAAETGD